jgi:hypothetical protein
LVVKADLPDLQEKDIDVRVENNTLTIRGEWEFGKNLNEDNAAANTEKMSKTGLGPKKSWATNQLPDQRKRGPLRAVTA